MNCLRCGEPFSPSDITVMEEGELPVCDLCDAEEYHFQVDYDGGEEFYEFINKEIVKKTCYHCFQDKYELVNLTYGKPVKVRVKCSDCSTECGMAIYIKFV